MDRLLGYLRQDFGKRHACLSMHPDGQEVLLFKAMGRNGNWPVEITLEEDGGVLSICSTLPLTIAQARRQAISLERNLHGPVAVAAHGLVSIL